MSESQPESRLGELNPPEDPEAFATAAAESTPSLAAEFWQFLGHNKKWWLLPIVIVLLVFSVLIFLAGTGAAPVIYSFF